MEESQASGKTGRIKITAENIPAATQLYTPRWIVRYKVENTLGKLWMSLKPESKLRNHMPYYIESPEGNTPSSIYRKHDGEMVDNELALRDMVLMDFAELKEIAEYSLAIKKAIDTLGWDYS